MSAPALLCDTGPLLSYLDPKSPDHRAHRTAPLSEIQRGVFVPEVLRPFLRAWWERAGAPGAGTVLPVRRARRIGPSTSPVAAVCCHRR